MNKKKILRIALLLLVILIGIALWRFLTADDSESGGLIVSGNIEITDTRLSFKIPGRLVERAVEEGDSIHAGQLVARLEASDQELAVAQSEANLSYARAVLAEREAGSRVEDIRQAQAQVEQARAFLAELEAGSRDGEIGSARAEVLRARAALKGARSQLELARADRDRYTALYKQKVVSFREYDRVRKTFESAQSAVEQAEASLSTAQEGLNLREEGFKEEQVHQARAALHQAEAAYARIKAGPRAEAVDQARAQVRIAEEALRLARRQVTYTTLTSPMDGVVLSTAAEPGEYLMTGSPVITIGNLDRVWLRAYINERDLGRIRLGQPAAVSTDSYPGKTYRGRIGFISSEAEFTPKSVQTFEERVKLMYRIKIDLSNPQRELKPGMPADARIDVEPPPDETG